MCTLLFNNYFNCLYLAYVVDNNSNVSTWLFDIWDCHTRISIGIRADILFDFLGEILGKILSGSCARKIVLLRSSMNLVSSYVFEWSLEVEDGLLVTGCVVALW